MVSSKQTDDVTYSVLTEKQWRVYPRDFIEALKLPGIRNKITGTVEVYSHTRLARAMTRYSYQRGAITAGGITYMSLFSLAAQFTVAWTVFAHMFSRNPGFQASVVRAVNSALPGVLDDPSTGTKGLISPEAISFGSGNTVAGVVAFGVALFAAIRIVQYISNGIRAMFGLLPFPRGPQLTIASGLAGLLILTVTVAATASLTALSELALGRAGELFPWIQRFRDSVPFDIFSFLIPLVINIVAFALFVRFVAWVRVPKRSLMIGSLSFGVIAALLRVLGTVLVGSAAGDPVISAAAAVGTLMLWINFLSRFALQICAWMANPPAVVGHVSADDVHAKETPNYVTLSDPRTLDWPYNPISGSLIAADEEDEAAASDQTKSKNSDQTKSRKQRSAKDRVMTGPLMGPEEPEWTSTEGVATEGKAEKTE